MALGLLNIDRLRLDAIFDRLILMSDSSLPIALRKELLCLQLPLSVVFGSLDCDI